MKHAFAMSANFFAQPLEKKDALEWTTPQANRGYVAHGREKVSQLNDAAEVEKIRSAVPDLKESFEIGRDNETGHPNNWPEEEGAVRGFKEDMKSFFQECKALHIQVMRAIATGMGFEESFFDRFLDVGDNTLRLLHYPAVKSDVFNTPGQVRAGEHSVRNPNTPCCACTTVSSNVLLWYRITDPLHYSSKTTAAAYRSKVQMEISSTQLLSRIPSSSMPEICWQDGATTRLRAPFIV